MLRALVRGVLVAGLFSVAALTLLAVAGQSLFAQAGTVPSSSTLAAPSPGPVPVTKPAQPASGASSSGSLANPWVVNGLLGVLGVATLLFLGAFFASLRKDPRFAVETSWGGFGGGLGGWTLSPSLVYLIATLVLAGMLCMAVSKAAGPASPAKDATFEASKGTK